MAVLGGGTTATKGESTPSTGKKENVNTTKAQATTARTGVTSATETTAKVVTTVKTKATTTVNWQENKDWSDFM